LPIEEVTIPLPTELNTPPVTKMYLTMPVPRNNLHFSAAINITFLCAKKIDSTPNKLSMFNELNLGKYA
jgi:hypothetical protein